MIFDVLLSVVAFGVWIGVAVLIGKMLMIVSRSGAYGSYDRETVADV